MVTKETRGVILIRSGRVYDQGGNVDLPPFADLLIVDGLIAAVRPGIAQAVERGVLLRVVEDEAVHDLDR